MRVKWFAGTDEIARMGPFDSILDAWSSLELNKDTQERTGRKHPKGAYVWPEQVKK